MSDIVIHEHDSLWASDFDDEKTRLLSEIAIKGMMVHHIGSTSVSSLAAKPIIDILLEVPSVETLDRYYSEFQQMGYEVMGEFGIPGRRYFRKSARKRTHHLHAFSTDTHNVKRHLAFRDYLATHPDVAKEYQSVKYWAAEQCDGDSAKYCELKNDFVVHHEQLALQWAEQA